MSFFFKAPIFHLNVFYYFGMSFITSSDFNIGKISTMPMEPHGQALQSGRRTADKKHGG